MAVDVRILGPLELLVDRRAVRVGSARQRTLLAALALEAGSAVPVDRLVEALWEEDPPRNALGNLQSYVSRLRAAAGSQLIGFDGGGYRLAGADLATDLQRVTELVEEARQERAERPHRAIELLGEALLCWRGPALLDVLDVVAFAPERARLDELRLAVAEERCELLVEQGRARDALPDLEQLAAAHPLREPTHILLLRALAATGRTAEALRAGDRFRSQLAEETGLEPTAELRCWEQRVLDGDHVDPHPPPPSPGAAPLSPGRMSGDLPREGRFFGRRWELQDLGERLESARVVTVTGPGGVGKTRLVAEALSAGVVGGPSAVVELARVGHDGVPTAVAAAVGLTVGEGSLADALVEFLSVERLVLVLDNCEHVAGAVADLAASVVAHCPEVRVLATSRRRIGVTGERVLPLQPLPVRSHDGQDAGDDAVALFLDRAGALTTEPAELGFVAQICRRLDGLPLAVELAAHRAETFGLRGLLSRLDTALDLLERPTAAAQRRHATLRTVVEWSYSLLTPDAQLVLDALSVFEGGMELDDAEAVAGVVTGQPAAALIAQLVDASMLVTHHVDAAVRYRMFEMVRQHGREQLERRGVHDAVRAGHARAMVERVERIEQAAVGPDERAALAALRRERDNVRVALAWLVAHDPRTAGRLAAHLGEVLLYRPEVEVLAWLRAAAHASEAAAEPPDAGVAGAASRAAFLQGDLEVSQRLARRALELPGERLGAVLGAHSLGVVHLYAGRLDDAVRWFRHSADAPGARQPGHMDAIGGVALAACFAGDIGAARERAGELWALAEAIGSVTYQAFARYVAAEVTAATDDDAARSLLASATDLAVEAGADFVTGLSSVALVAALVRLGRPDEALDRIGPLMDLWRRAGTWTQQWTTLRQLANLLTERDPATALLLLDAADRDPAAPAVVGAERARLDALRHRLAASLEPGDAARTARLASTLTRAQVLHLARQRVSTDDDRA